MKSLAEYGKVSDLQALLEEAASIQPSLVILFTSSNVLANAAHCMLIREILGPIPSLGCSTSGEIHADGVDDGIVSIVAMHFERTAVHFAVADVSDAEHSFSAGAEIGRQLNESGLKTIFSLCPGVNINGSQYVKGLSSVVDPSVVISGGLAGDGINFQKTYTLLNGDVFSDRVVAFGLYGDHVQVSTGSKGGWSPFGPTRKVTRSEGNVLFELDGKPALELYKQYLGDKAADLPSSGLLYPFAILREDHSTTGLIRTILDINHEAGSLILAGDLPQGSTVCLMHANTDSLVNGSERAAQETQHDSGNIQGAAAILVSCVGRKLVMGGDVDEEVEVVRNILGDKVAVGGFYSYGEICPFEETGLPELHNQTMTITYITEKAA